MPGKGIQWNTNILLLIDEIDLYQKVQYLNPYVEGYGTKTVLQITPKKKKDRIHSYVGLAEEYKVNGKMKRAGRQM